MRWVVFFIIAFFLCCCSNQESKVNECELFLQKNHYLVEESLNAGCLDHKTLMINRYFSTMHLYIGKIENSEFVLKDIFCPECRDDHRTWDNLIDEVQKTVSVGEYDSTMFFQDFKSFVCFLEKMSPSQFDSAYQSNPVYATKFNSFFFDHHGFENNRFAPKNDSQIYMYDDYSLLIYSFKTESRREVGVYFVEKIETGHRSNYICPLNFVESTDSTVRLRDVCGAGAELYYHEPTDSIEISLVDTVSFGHQVRHYKLNGDTIIRPYYKPIEHDSGDVVGLD